MGEGKTWHGWGRDTSTIPINNLFLSGGSGNDVYGRHFANESVLSDFEGEGVDIVDVTILVDFNNQVIDANLDLSVA